MVDHPRFLDLRRKPVTGEEMARQFPSQDRVRVAHALANGARNSLKAAAAKASYFSQPDVAQNARRAMRLLSPRSLQAHGSEAVIQARAAAEQAKAKAFSKEQYDFALQQIDGVESELMGLGR